MSTTTTLTAPAILDGHVLEHDTSMVPPGRDREKSGVAYIDTPSRILAVIERYRLLQPGQPGTLPESNTKFLEHIAASISNGRQPIRMCLPAFPFKSPNTATKVLGRLPDKAEEFALAHLHGMCAAIQDIYEPGAKLTIISDGLVYNDLLGVSDRDVWAYGTALRSMSAEKGFSRHISFARLKDLVEPSKGNDDTQGSPGMEREGMGEIVYVCNATRLRHLFLFRFGDENLDVSGRIKEDDDTCMTYRGYIRFLATDLLNVYPTGPRRSKSQYKKGVEYIAKQMLSRGDAFARAVKQNFADQLRLSIHPSTFENKISVSLLPTDTSFTTPWHCTIGFRLDGTTTTGHRERFEADDSWELVYEDGRPSFFRERSDLYSLGGNEDTQSCVSISPIYPAGLMVRPLAVGRSASNPDGRKQKKMGLGDIDAQKLRGLSEHNSPVVLRGFAGTTDRDRFVAKAHELGEPTPWKFGLVLEVKDVGTANTGALNNVLSAEWMPWHYDGLFKTETRTNPEDGTETVVSIPPKFQMFTSITTSPKDTGFTLFASSSLVTRYLSDRTLSQLPPLEELRPLKWTVQTGGFGNLQLTHLPLFVDHPTTGRPCFRFHEPWPASRTRFQPTSVTIEEKEKEESERICAGLSTLLHDRRVAYYHAWEKGDFLVSDNVLALHTRSDFTAGCDRELWRIHFD
ncbi:pyoverdine/dityrosine biosynthesis protein [Apiospora arundinis]|uniref:Pyoverdine/dityrosine biosynthesis protein n=1 Tax=Apiospora arundinis TaxID=335852 RepID=A0ABR2I4V5_9PEZI